MFDIVIPCLNESQFIGDNIQSILDQSYQDFNLFIVDGGSTDDTVQIIKNFEKKDTRVHLLNNPKKTTPYALNIGINEGVGKYVVIFGGHAKMLDGYLEHSYKILEENQTIGCTGGIIQSNFQDNLSRFISQAMTSKVGVGNVTFRVGGEPQFADTVAFGAYRRSVFNKVGLFDTALTRNQDDEFNFRVTKAGYKILFDPKIKSEYYVRGNFKKLWKQYLQYGYWKAFVNKKHKNLLSIRQIIPPLFVFYVAIGALLSILNYWILIVYVGSLAFYLSILLAESLRLGKNNFYKIFTSFLILHFSYGLGYLKGALDFFVLKKSINHKMNDLTR